VCDGGSLAAKQEKRVVVDDSTDSLVSWTFRTVKNDIGFGVTFVPEQKGKHPVVVVPNKRIDSHLKAVEGLMHVTEKGTLILTFDNSYSSWTSKEVLYVVNKLAKAATADVPDPAPTPSIMRQAQQEAGAKASAAANAPIEPAPNSPPAATSPSAAAEGIKTEPATTPSAATTAATASASN
jgi:hypothetical protein